MRAIENLVNTGEILDTKELLECFGCFWLQRQEVIDLLLENKLDHRLFQHNKYAGSMKCLDSKLFHDLGKRFRNTVIKDFFLVESEYNNFTQEPIISDEEIEYLYQAHLEEMKLRDEDQLIVDSTKNVESLIDIFYSEPRILGDTGILIDKIIEISYDFDYGYSL